MGKANQSQFKNYQPTIEEFIDSAITYSDMAEIILDRAIFTSRKKNLMNEIDEALMNGNKELFIQLSNQYNVLLRKYRYLKDFGLYN